MGVLVITVGWLIFAIGLCGWGWFVARIAARALRVDIAECVQLSTLFWLGFAAALAVSQIWNFFGPINTSAAIGFWTVGAIGFADLARVFRLSWTQLNAKIDLNSWWILAVPVLVMLAREATHGPENWDSPVYHFASIKWAQSYPVVPGLGNLMGHLAFNQSFFLFAALLDVGVLYGHGYQLANSLLCAAISCQIIAVVYRVWKNSSLRQPRLWMHLTLAVPLFYEMSGLGHGIRQISSPTPDLALSVLEGVLALRLVMFVFPDEKTRSSQTWELFVIGTLGIAAVTVKLSAVVFVFAVFAAAVAVEYRRTEKQLLVRPATVLVCTAAALFLPWIGRGIVLSGYPAYPSSFGGIPVDWKIPVEDVRDMHQAIVGWARKPGPANRTAVNNWEWLPEWRQRMWARVDVRIFVFVVFGALLCWIILYMRRGRWWSEPTLYWIAPLLPPLAGIVFWFLIAPAVRFLGIIPWILPAWLLVWMLDARTDNTLRLVRVLGLPPLVFACALFAAPRHQPLTPWPPGKLGLAMVPKAEIQTRITDSGLKVRTPVHGEYIWNAKLPATHRFNPLLQQRSRKLINGFRVSGSKDSAIGSGRRPPNW